ncbi:hypothetical protein MCOR10_007001, partial [Pyricularia oryzae]
PSQIEPRIVQTWPSPATVSSRTDPRQHHRMPDHCGICAGSGLVTYDYAVCSVCNGASMTSNGNCGGNGRDKCWANHPGVVIYDVPKGRTCPTCNGTGLR